MHIDPHSTSMMWFYITDHLSVADTLDIWMNYFTIITDMRNVQHYFLDLVSSDSDWLEYTSAKVTNFVCMCVWLCGNWIRINALDNKTKPMENKDLGMSTCCVCVCRCGHFDILFCTITIFKPLHYHEITTSFHAYWGGMVFLREKPRLSLHFLLLFCVCVKNGNIFYWHRQEMTLLSLSTFTKFHINNLEVSEAQLCLF